MTQSADEMEAARYRFGVFELDVATGVLRREGAVVRLQAQPMLALACLVKSAGHVVTREELCKAVWGEETFVDFERGLNFCVAQVREALKDDATSPRFLRTIPKRGYQFIAPVEKAPGYEEKTGEERRPDVHTGQESPPETVSRGLSTGNTVLLFAVALLAALAFGLGFRLLSTQRTGRAAAGARRAVVAVVRFDNETGNADLTRFADGLTQTVVEQLTSQSRQRYGVIGNAAILQLPRDMRDLKEIAASLGAGYIVLGQVQADGSQTRILAHLIRMPEQTHIWVVRVDRAITEPLTAEADLAQRIATDFSDRIAKDASGSPLPPFPSH